MGIDKSKKDNINKTQKRKEYSLRFCDILKPYSVIAEYKALFLFMPILSQSFFAFVSGDLMSFSFFTARHDD